MSRFVRSVLVGVLLASVHVHVEAQVLGFVESGHPLDHARHPVTEYEGFGWIVDSSPTLNGARATASRFSLEGWMPLIVPVYVEGRSRHRVVLGEYQSQQQALRSRDTLPLEVRSDAWIAYMSIKGGKADRPNVYAETRTGRVRLARSRTYERPVAVSRVDPVQGPVVTFSHVKAAHDALVPDAVLFGGEREILDEFTQPFSVSVSKSGSSDTPSENPIPRNSPRERLRQRVTAELGLLNRYDSNIDHDEENLQSFGSVPALRASFRNRLMKPALIVNYAVGRHRYTNTDDWDRWSHMVVGIFRPDQSGRLRFETKGEVSRAGTSEDRDLSNQVQIGPEVEYRFSSDYRLHLYGTLRWKRFPEEPERASFKPNIGTIFEQKLDNGGSLEAGVRWEVNDIERERSRYTRYTFSLDYEAPLSDRSELEFEITTRRKLYTSRYVEIEDEDFLRRDFRWVLEAIWTYQLRSNIRFELGYKYERRDSRDPEKEFVAHLLDFGLYFAL